MKKYIAFATVAIMMAAAGCQKMNDIQTEDQNMKVEFTVADKPSFGANTKAVKTSWAVGDKIAIALKPSSSENILSEKISNSEYSGVAILLEYTESGWTAEKKIELTNGTNGTFYALHHRGDIKLYFNALGTETPESIYSLSGYPGGEIMSFTGDYSVANNGNIILETIAMALDSRIMQISVAEELFSTEGNLYLSEGLDTYDMSCVIPNPENTLKMSIYKNWTAGGIPSTLAGYVALQNGSVGVDFADANIFTLSSADAYKTGATAVLNYNYDEDVDDYDYSFYFAYTSGKDMMLKSYTFYIERTPEEGAEYTISYDKLYQTVTKSETRTLAKGKAIRLSDQGWTAVMN